MFGSEIALPTVTGGAASPTRSVLGGLRLRSFWGDEVGELRQMTSERELCDRQIGGNCLI